jgi:hypothetical protein
MIRTDDAQVIRFVEELDTLNMLLPPAERVYAYKVGANGYGRNAVPMFSHDADFWAAVSDLQTANGHRRMFEAQAARSPVKAEKPFRAWINSPCFSGSWDFATVEEARQYLTHQINAKRGRVYIGGAPAGPDAVDPMGSFVQGPEGVVETIYEMGWSRRGPDGCYVFMEPAAPVVVETVTATHPERGETATITTTYDANVLATSSRFNRVTAVLDFERPLSAVSDGEMRAQLGKIERQILASVDGVTEVTVHAGLASAQEADKPAVERFTYDSNNDWFLFDGCRVADLNAHGAGMYEVWPQGVLKEYIAGMLGSHTFLHHGRAAAELYVRSLVAGAQHCHYLAK